MSTDTRQTFADFAREHGISMTADRAAENPNMDDSHDMDHWRCVMRRRRRRMTVIFSMGYGHKGAQPDVSTVLGCLASDAPGASQDFDEWCRDLGYDTDSRRAHHTWLAVRRQTAKLDRFIGDPGLMESLLDCEE